MQWLLADVATLSISDDVPGELFCLQKISLMINTII
jgi:hypothetical protein